MCNSIDGFDYFNLTVLTWFINLDQQHCLPVNQTQPLSQCTLDMAICHSFGSPGPCQNSSVCSFSEQGDLSLGAYRQDPLSPLEAHSSIKGFQAVFTNGSPYSTASNISCLLQTSIVFLCNASAVWATPDFPESRKKALDPKLISYNNKTCQLSLIFDFAGACELEPISGESLSVGTILIVIFFVSVILYFVFGTMINLARGRVGADMIPHARFWAMLPVYISDGCQFVFCCGQRSVTATYEQI